MTKLSKSTPTNLPANPATLTSTAVATRTRDFTYRKGTNDKPVEIYYDGQFVASFMSCLRAGDFFLLDGKAFGSKEPVCMLCKSAPTIDTRYSQENPTIVMGVTEIAQAPPTLDPVPRLAAVSREVLPMLPGNMYTHEHVDTGEVTGFKPPRSGLFDDSAEDVDFKE